MQNLAAVEIRLFVLVLCSFFRYQMSYNGAAMKAFSAHMPIFWPTQLQLSG